MVITATANLPGFLTLWETFNERFSATDLVTLMFIANYQKLGNDECTPSPSAGIYLNSWSLFKRQTTPFYFDKLKEEVKAALLDPRVSPSQKMKSESSVATFAWKKLWKCGQASAGGGGRERRRREKKKEGVNQRKTSAAATFHSSEPQNDLRSPA